eukprot:TRINITY_DN60504_c0_g1_i1.p1 TRINITY_DN60504_c0_g1~~TRINITY_DN60504_c0_g1_i1.p1  ORF type:complete len:741 (+),score=203.91 TRINITY_DN60504_c0_g1_i1:89-2311(+)
MNAVAADPDGGFIAWLILWLISGIAVTVGFHIWTFRPAVRRLQDAPTPPPPHYYAWVAVLLFLHHVSTIFFDYIGRLDDDEWRARMEVDQFLAPFWRCFWFLFAGVAVMVGADVHAGDQVEVAHLLQCILVGAFVLGTVAAGVVLGLSYGSSDVLRLFVDDSKRHKALPYFVIKVASTPLVAIQQVALGYFLGSSSSNSTSSPALKIWSYIMLAIYVAGVLAYSLLIEFADLGLVGQALGQLLVTLVWFAAVLKAIWQAPAEARERLAVWRPLSRPFIRGRAAAFADLFAVAFLRTVVRSGVDQLRVHYTDRSRNGIIQALRVLGKAEYVVDVWSFYQEAIAMMVLAHANGAAKMAAELQLAAGEPGEVPAAEAARDFHVHVRTLLRQLGMLVVLELIFLCVQGGGDHTPLHLFVDTFADQGYEAAASKSDVRDALAWLWYANALSIAMSLARTLYVAMLCACHDFAFLRNSAVGAFAIAAAPCMAAAAATKEEKWLWAAGASFDAVHVLLCAWRFHGRGRGALPGGACPQPPAGEAPGRACKHAESYFRAAHSEGRFKGYGAPRRRPGSLPAPYEQRRELNGWGSVTASTLLGAAGPAPPWAQHRSRRSRSPDPVPSPWGTRGSRDVGWMPRGSWDTAAGDAHRPRTPGSESPRGDPYSRSGIAGGRPPPVPLRGGFSQPPPHGPRDAQMPHGGPVSSPRSERGSGQFIPHLGDLSVLARSHNSAGGNTTSYPQFTGRK